MKIFVPCLVILAGLTTNLMAEEPAEQREFNWPEWRGPLATGVAPHGNPPLKWSEEENVDWKVEIPGLGYSSPIVWGDQVFVLTAVDTGKKGQPTAKPDTAQAKEQRPTGDRPRGRGRGRGRGGRGRRPSEAPTTIHDFVVMSLDRKSGNVIWKKTARSQVPHEGFRPGDNSFASASPVTDGKYLYASFGSFGIYCYDLNGKLIWEKDLGDFHMRNGFGEGGTPALHGDWLIVNCDQETDSFIVGMNAKTGEIQWKIDRDEASSWGTPLIVEFDGKTQVVVNGANRVRSYDINNGKVIWECGGQTGNVIPAPVRLGDNVICMSGWKGTAIFSIPLSAQGDISGTDTINWYYDRSSDYRAGTPYVPSPLLYGDALYFLKSYNGILTRMSAVTGEVDYDNKRLASISRVYASPVGAADRVYIAGRGGTTMVLKLSPEYEVLATNKLDSPVDATPAIVGDQMIVRGQKYLYCFREK
ncbi:Outer membrane protein assembly factor BamB [Symmachiella dynata]|uniref:PQQ-binding-like beta-propeller repeat protein n=1 Tax=Symmachiella dynata TaxID=2527995 RepID=UPI00118C2308|nr:PQQ-binding-like beta-propeller repeat protein [Symmachiella dynata]QDT50900.1 Outer membrane protein assembly factor BamB [Symmachiella dynata]